LADVDREMLGIRVPLFAHADTTENQNVKIGLIPFLCLRREKVAGKYQHGRGQRAFERLGQTNGKLMGSSMELNSWGPARRNIRMKKVPQLSAIR
jgi:hypothetical protein